MNESDCLQIAKDANIQFESLVDIFYDEHFAFGNCESNMKAANQLKSFCTKQLEEEAKAMEVEVELLKNKPFGSFTKECVIF